MQHTNHFAQDTDVTYYGSVVGYDFYMTDDNIVLIQFGEQEQEYMSMSLESARRIEQHHYRAAVMLWDLHQQKVA